MAMYIVAQKVYRLIIAGPLVCDTRSYEFASFQGYTPLKREYLCTSLFSYLAYISKELMHRFINYLTQEVGLHLCHSG